MNEESANQRVNIFEQINEICREFRRKCKLGERPSIEDWLSRINSDARTTLFSNLLDIEIRSREKNGECPGSREYIERFPQFASQIRQAFDESTMGSMNIVHSTPADSKGQNVTRTFELPAANRLGDYELLGELGRGGFGVVYEARHRKGQNLVALKTLPTGMDGQELNAERLHKFRREFRSLSEINHPNLVGMQTLEVDGGQWFLTMDLVRGDDFLGYVRPNDTLDETRLRSTLAQLVRGIMALHERRIVHRDLKPSNVLVETDGRVVILDFGLVSELPKTTDQTASLRSVMFAGTPRYAAPEQMFGERSEASDWYGLGIMLYEALAGEPPYSGKLMELLRQKQNEDPPSLAGRGDIPNDLAELTNQLTKRDPQQRPDALAIAETLSLDVESKSHGSVDDDDLIVMTSAESNQVLIGREKQLVELEAARKEFLDYKEPVVVFISGRSGEGKSSLAEKFLRPIRLGTEMLVLSGRCYDRESVPYKAIDSLIDALVSFLRSRNQEEVRLLLPNDIHLLAYLFPLLRRVDSVNTVTTSMTADFKNDKLRISAFTVLRELMVNVSRNTPTVILIDDLQWGDADSAKVLFELISKQDPPQILFLGSYRIDEAIESPFLQMWNALISGSRIEASIRNVRVGPLSKGQCIDLAVLHTGADRQLISRRADELFKDTGGNPYFVEQLIDGIDLKLGIFERVPLQAIIEGRLHGLPADALSLLEVIAVSRQSISVTEASKAAGQSTPAMATLTHMRSERLVRLIGSEPLVDTYHDKIRDTILTSLTEDKRCHLHLQLAQIIEDQETVTGNQILEQYEATSKNLTETHPMPDRVFDLAYHFFEANDSRAFAYQLLAAEKVVKTYRVQDAQIAMEFLFRAESVMPDDAHSTIKHLLWLGYGPDLTAGSGWCDPNTIGRSGSSNR